MRPDRRSGFTLLELTVATGVSAIVFGGIVVASMHMRHSYRAVLQHQNAEQNARMAMDMIARDIRMAGYGLLTYHTSTYTGYHLQGGALNDWAGVTNPLIVGKSQADPAKSSLRILGAIDSPPVLIGATIAVGQTNVTVISGSASAFNTSDRSLACVGGRELVRVTGIAGNTLRVSTRPPSDAIVGLHYIYGANTAIDLLKFITYDWTKVTTAYPNGPYLRRRDEALKLSPDWLNMLAADIEDFQVVQRGQHVDVTIKGRSKLKDPNVGGDGYRRFTLSTRVMQRNAN
jgi:type II secretory pathway pseudopilin PulG